MAKVLTGQVVSVKMQDTVIVEVVWKLPHPMYKKLLKRSSRYKVALNGQEVQLGDTVRMEETRKMAKGKYFRIKEVVRAHEGGK